MTGTSLIISAMYATFNIVAHRPFTTDSFPYVLALLMVAAILTCLASLSLHQSPGRRSPKGAKLRNIRTLRGPAVRRH
ncbi:MAG: hypothetical protein R3D44_04455 [Hyphomicrobiaceae bacterium]